MSPLLEVEGLTIRFGGHLAVSNASFAADRGQVSGLIGPNGAGKTTTFNAICGVTPPTSGTIRLEGRSINRASTHARARMGIGRTFQRLEVFGSLSARENIQVGAEIRRTWSRRRNARPQLLAPAGRTDLDLDGEVDLIIERLDLGAVADVRVGQLPTGQARLVELGRALAARPALLLLDEPASGLDDNESLAFGELLVELAGQGLGILLVEHDVALVMRVCERVAVLDFGQIIAHGGPDEIRANEAVRSAYLGAVADAS
jgi:branched-chain amino acid transport system ATP-binding protein